MDYKKLCFDLADTPATSGDEALISEKALKYLSEYMPCKIDRLGNVIGTLGEGDIHILLDAHMDQVGLTVKGIDEKGFILIDKIGSVDIRVLTGAEVIIYGKEELFGVICSVPPHLHSSESSDKLNIKAMAVDIGLNREKAAELVSVGDRITFRNFQYELLNNCISSAAFDDRCAVTAILGALDIVKDKLKKIKLSVMFSAQEEVGCRGAGVGAFALMPDYAVAVDVGFGNDPYTDKTMTLELGKGPSVGISPTLDKELTDELINIAVQKNIPCQNDVMGGKTGTNADSISSVGCGVKTALLSVPLRYMHTANEIICVDDIENTAKLIAEFLLKKEAEANV